MRRDIKELNEAPISTCGVLYYDYRFFRNVANVDFGRTYNSDIKFFAKAHISPLSHNNGLNRFCKMVFIDRWCEIPFGQPQTASVIANEKDTNAFAYFGQQDPPDCQGALIAVSGIAEEGITGPLKQDYSPSVFIERLSFSIAHELGHLIIRQQFGEGWVDGSHRKNSPTALMGYVIPPAGLSSVTADSEEMSKIDLPNRASAQ